MEKTRSGTDEFDRNNMKVEKMDQEDNTIELRSAGWSIVFAKRCQSI